MATKAGAGSNANYFNVLFKFILKQVNFSYFETSNQEHHPKSEDHFIKLKIALVIEGTNWS